MHVNLARADLTAARHSDTGFTEAPDERPEDGNARAHLRNKFVRSLVFIDGGRVDGQRMVGAAFDIGTEMGKDFGHDLDIGNARHVVEHRLAPSENCCGDKFQRRVLRSGYADFPLEHPVARNDDFLFHERTPSITMHGKAAPEAEPCNINIPVHPL